MNTENKKICVLGAAGSIGSRLVALLHEQGYQVTAVVRSLSSAVRIGRFDVNLVTLDILLASKEGLAEVLLGHDVVIDCTYSTQGDYDKRISEAQLLAQRISSAAIKANVARLIHYGTISVYPNNAESIDETVECVSKGDSYADSKLVAEKIFLEQHSQNLSVTVLQLPIVFGPFMGWSSSPVQQMRNQKLVMPNDLKGRCSPLFVDDVYKATVLAFDCEAVFGQRILLSDTSLSWAEYYSAYAELSASLDLKFISRDEFVNKTKSHSYQIQPFQLLKKHFMDDGDFRQLILAQWGIRSVYRWVKKMRGQSGVDQIKQKITSSQSMDAQQTQTLLSSSNVVLFDTLPKVDSSKASQLLNMQAYTDFSTAIAMTQLWLKWARLVD